MIGLLGNSWAVFIGVTVVLAGGAAWLMGQALAGKWRPVWQPVLYAALLACAARFLSYALFGGELLSLSGYLIDAAVIIAIALVSYRLTQTWKMVNQYPWLYEQAGPFAWRRKPGAERDAAE